MYFNSGKKEGALDESMYYSENDIIGEELEIN